MDLTSIREKIIALWQGFNSREQMVLLVGGGVLFCYLLWMAIIVPVDSLVQQQKVRAESAENALTRVRSLAAKVIVVNNLPKVSSNQTASLAESIDITLRENGLTMRGFQPSSDGSAQLRLSAAPFTSVSQWLFQLENNHQITVQDLSINAGQGAGRVDVSVRLSRD